jgi:hypothetical protein
MALARFKPVPTGFAIKKPEKTIAVHSSLCISGRKPPKAGSYRELSATIIKIKIFTQ